MSILELWGIDCDQIENRDYDFVFHLLWKILIYLKTVKNNEWTLIQSPTSLVTFYHFATFASNHFINQSYR